MQGEITVEDLRDSVPMWKFNQQQTAPDGSASVIGGTPVPNGQRMEVFFSGSITGTLIAPNMVLTCAHGNPVVGTKWTAILADGTKRSYSTKRVWINPGFQSGAKYALGYDIAVCMLDGSVAGVTPAMLCDLAPTPKMDLDLCGYGNNVASAAGVNAGAGVKRIGKQVVDFVLPTHILWKFDAGEANSYSNGDSGAPCFVAGTNQIVGVQSGISAGTGNKVGVPGTQAFASRVDGMTGQWVRSVVALAK